MLTLLAENDISPIKINPGNSVSVMYTDPSGKTEEVCVVEEASVMDYVAVYRVRDELGLEDGYMGVFGKRKDS